VRLPDATEVGLPVGSKGRSVRRTPLWSALAVVFVLVGAASSVFAAGQVAHDAGKESQRSFATSAAQIATTMQSAFQHENDLISGVQAFILDHPKATEAEFLQWARADRAMARYGELQGFGETEIVPSSQLAAFATHAAVASATGLSAQGSFAVTPPGRRAFYCLSIVGLDRSPDNGLPSGFDLCAGTNGTSLLASRDSGLADLESLRLRNVTTLEIGLPVYLGERRPRRSPGAARRSSVG